jgi:hypothetical protein
MHSSPGGRVSLPHLGRADLRHAVPAGRGRRA